MTEHPAPHRPHDDAQAEQILALFAREARIDRALLLPDARADTLGIGSLDLTLALFALEDAFDVQLPDLLSPGQVAPTVGELVQQVQQAIRDRADRPRSPPPVLHPAAS